VVRQSARSAEVECWRAPLRALAKTFLEPSVFIRWLPAQEFSSILQRDGSGAGEYCKKATGGLGFPEPSVLQ